MSDADLRALERAVQLGEPGAEARLAIARMRATGRDPRRDPRAEDVVDAPGPGMRKRAGRGGGAMCRAKGRVVVAIWPQELVGAVEAWRDDGTRDEARVMLTLPAGTHVDRGIYYDSYRDETSIQRVRMPGRDGWGRHDWVSVRVRGRVVVVVPDDRLDSYEVEWAPVLYPETADGGQVEEALRTIEAAGLPAADVAALRKRLAPRAKSGLASATVCRGEAKTDHISRWRDWAKSGTVRRVGS